MTFITGKAIPMWDMDQKKKNLQKSIDEKEGSARKRKKSLIPDS